MKNFSYSSKFSLGSLLLLDEIDEDSVYFSSNVASYDTGSNYSYTVYWKGSLSLKESGDDATVDGTLSSIEVEHNGKSVLSVTNLDQDVSDLDDAGSDEDHSLSERASFVMSELMAGSDKVEGSSKADTLSGYAGKDWLYGNKGGDVLKGGNGHDRLTGGAGADKLTGGAGSDHFIFKAASESRGSKGHDTITDFSGANTIDLRGIDARTDRNGNNSFKFIGDDDFSGKSGELREENGILKGDTNGDGKMDFLVEVDFANSSRSGLHADNFYL